MSEINNDFDDFSHHHDDYQQEKVNSSQEAKVARVDEGSLPDRGNIGPDVKDNRDNGNGNDVGSNGSGSSSSGKEVVKSIDHFIGEIGLGKYQYIIIAVFSIGMLCDGAQVVAISFLSIILKNIWGLSEFDVSLFGSCIFTGIFAGSLISGIISDAFGRIKIFLWTFFLYIVANLVSSLSPNFFSIVISRTIFGLCSGVIIPLGYVIIVEITPIEWRGKIISMATIVFTIGQILSFIIGYFIIDSFNGSGHWRIFQLWATILAIIAFIMALIYLRESPRYVLYENFDEGVAILEDLYEINHGNDNRQGQEGEKSRWKMNIEEKNALKKGIQKQMEDERFAHAPFVQLFQGINALITPLVWYMCLGLALVYYGVVYMMPIILNGSHEQNPNAIYFQLLVTTSGEVPAYFLCYYTVEEPAFGRKNSMTYCILLSGVFSLLAFFTHGWFMIANVFMLRLFCYLSFGYVIPFISEVYHTKSRTTGLGFALGLDRFGGAVMPWISNYAYAWKDTGPFLVYGLFLIVGFFAAFLLPYDTQGIELDQLEVKRRQGGGVSEDGNAKERRLVVNEEGKQRLCGLR